MSKTNPTTGANGASKSYLGSDAADLKAAKADPHAEASVEPGPLAAPDRPTQLTGQDGKPLPAAQQPPGGHPSDPTSSTSVGSRSRD